MTMSEVEVDRITRQVFAARNSGLDAALVKVVIDEIEAATTTEAMLATLVERGVLTREGHCDQAYAELREFGGTRIVTCGEFGGPVDCPSRYVTAWVVTS